MSFESTEAACLRYDPNRLLDAVLEKTHSENDHILAKKLKVHIDVLHRIRSKALPIGASLLLWLQEITGASICELRQLMGDRRMRVRLSYAGSP
jgi:hypothetical protein